MKNLVVLIAIVFTCLVSSCYQRTCPTYTKGLEEAPQQEQTQEQTSEQAEERV